MMTMKRFFSCTLVLLLLTALIAVLGLPSVHAADDLKIGIGGSPAFNNSPARLELKPGSYALLKIEGGKLPYTITMSSPILEIKQIGQGSYREYDWVDYRVYPKTAGTTVLTVKDRTGKTLTRQVVVYDPSILPLRMSALPGASDPVAVGQGRNFEVSRGKAPYKVISANPAVARIEQHPAVGTYSVWGVSAGSTQITATDASGVKVQGIVHVTTKKPLSFRVSDTMLLNGVTELIISSGNPPYTLATSSNLKAVLQGTDSEGVTRYKLSATTVGKGMVSVRDAQGQIQSRSITVLEWVTLSFPQLTGNSPFLDVGQTTNLAVTGGKPPYTVTVDKPAAVTIQQQGEGKYTVTANQPGVVFFTAKDSSGAKRSKSLTIREVYPLKLLAMTVLAIGDSDNIVISGGKAPYTVTVSGNQLTLTKIDEKKYTITAKLPGQATISVKDSIGAIQQRVVKVTAPPLTLLVEKFPLQVGSKRLMEIKGGVAPYVLKLSNPTVKAELKETTPKSSKYEITGSTAGDVDIVVTDSVGTSTSVRLLIEAAQAPLKIAVSSNRLTLPDQGQQAKTEHLTIEGGAAPYTVTASSQLKLRQISATKYEIIPQSTGSGTITVKDSTGAIKQLTVTVPAAPSEVSAPLRITFSQKPLAVKASRQLTVQGGVGPYTLTLSNNNAKQSSAGTVSNIAKYLITGVSPGQVTIVVKDSTGATASVSLTIPGPLKLSVSAQDMIMPANGQQPKTEKLTIQGGIAPYTVKALGSIALKQISPDQYEIIPKAAGGGLITVQDRSGTIERASVAVHVPPTVVLQKDSITVGEMTKLSIKGGLTPYTVTLSNTNAKAFKRSWSEINTTYEITGVARGSVDITIQDKRGASISVRLTVK